MREVIHDSGQRWMSQVRQQLRLAPERAALFVGRGESLFAHAAMAKLMNDAIALAENCVGGKHRGASRILARMLAHFRGQD